MEQDFLFLDLEKYLIYLADKCVGGNIDFKAQVFNQNKVNR